jgi:NAD(P)-dependent dehydrogenase (short-subunit alcohol dehydrogenase family)
MQSLGRAAKVPLFGHRDEIAKLAEIHLISIPYQSATKTVLDLSGGVHNKADEMSPPATNPDFTRLSPPPGSRVLVVGGCGAIGRVLVSACLSLHHHVAIFALPRSIAAYPPQPGALTIPVDAADEASVQSGAAALGRHWSAVDVLVFMVGFMTVPPRPIDELDSEEWDNVQSGNLRSAYLVSRAILPLLRASVNPSIVNVGSSLAYNPLPGEAAYAASKAGLVALTKSIAMENAPKVRANLVAPSAIDTHFLAGGGGERGARAAKLGGDAWFRDMSPQYVPTIPLGRIAKPEDIVGPVLFLAGPAAAFITGQVLHVNGGRITP